MDLDVVALEAAVDSLIEAVGVDVVALDVAVGAIEVAGDTDEDGDVVIALTGEEDCGPSSGSGQGGVGHGMAIMDTLTDVTMVVTTAMNVTTAITHPDLTTNIMAHRIGGLPNKNGLQDKLPLPLKNKKRLTTRVQNIGKYLTAQIAN